LASNVNYQAGENVPNLAVVKIGEGGNVCITTFAKSHIIADLSGYHAAGGAGFVPIFPKRIKDTRLSASVPAGGVLTVSAAGFGVPDDAIGAVFNITVVNPQRDGFVTAYACDAPRPEASNLNYVAGQTVANLAMLGLGTTGELCLYSMSATDLLVDTTGYFQANTGSGFSGVTPTRVIDTRTANHLNANETRPLSLSGLPDSAVGVVVNVTATQAEAGGYLTVFPCGQVVPSVSSVNYIADRTVPNLAAVGVGPDKSICVYSLAATDVIVDITGFYGTGTYSPASTSRTVRT
jgi:hypothetical protein